MTIELTKNRNGLQFARAGRMRVRIVAEIEGVYLWKPYGRFTVNRIRYQMPEDDSIYVNPMIILKPDCQDIPGNPPVWDSPMFASDSNPDWHYRFRMREWADLEWTPDAYL